MTPLAQRFDPYDQWLQIPPDDQPADHYRLLGLPRFESSADKIAAAADERMALVRSLQLGPHGEVSQRILNELAAAKTRLLDPARRTAYDAVLRSSAAAGREDPEAWPPGARGMLPNKSELHPGDMVGDYKILERASASTLGVTYKVQHHGTRGYYFLKTLPPKAAKKEEVRKRFQREIDILGRLNHPNLIVAVDRGEHHGLPFLVLDYVLGADLSRLVREHGPLPVEQAVDYAVQTARGLAELHANGVFHRNIKPHALLVDFRGNLRITNLLLAKIGEGSAIDAGEEALTMEGESMGSIDYLPPEQAVDSSKADQRSDIYALGCSLYYLLTGQPPYPLKSSVDKLLAHRQAPIPSPRRLRGEIPVWLEAAIRKMMAKRQADRHQNAEEVIEALTNPSAAEPWWRSVALALRSAGAKLSQWVRPASRESGPPVAPPV
jgi:serine/threonine protein kinase